MPKIFFLNHPDKEPRYPKSAPIRSIIRVPWNCSTKHKRKFIMRQGAYISGKNVISDTLYFWGEYEPPTHAVLVKTTIPKAVHYKLTPVTSLPAKAQNTDPYVYGCFRNICCRRHKKVKYSPGDVLVFGKMDSSNNTIEIDTVIVVEKMELVSKLSKTSQYYKASVLPLPIPRPRDYVEGLLYSAELGYFSFVPCLPASKINAKGNKHILAARAFTKPILHLSSFGTIAHKNKMCRAVQLTPTYWANIITAVHNAGLELGIDIKKI